MSDDAPKTVVSHYGLHDADGVKYLHQRRGQVMNFISMNRPSPFEVMTKGAYLAPCPHFIYGSSPIPDPAHWNIFMRLYEDPLVRYFLPIPKDAMAHVPYIEDPNNDLMLCLVLLSRLGSPIYPVVHHFRRISVQRIREELSLTNVLPFVVVGLSLEDHLVVEEIVAVARTAPRQLILAGCTMMTARAPIEVVKTSIGDFDAVTLHSVPMESLGAVALRRFARGEEIDAPWMPKVEHLPSRLRAKVVENLNPSAGNNTSLGTLGTIGDFDQDSAKNTKGKCADTEDRVSDDDFDTERQERDLRAQHIDAEINCRVAWKLYPKRKVTRHGNKIQCAGRIIDYRHPHLIERLIHELANLTIQVHPDHVSVNEVRGKTLSQAVVLAYLEQSGNEKPDIEPCIQIGAEDEVVANIDLVNENTQDQSVDFAYLEQVQNEELAPNLKGTPFSKNYGIEIEMRGKTLAEALASAYLEQNRIEEPKLKTPPK